MTDKIMKEPPLWKLGLACIVGNGIETYDFTLFGILAPIIGRLFFPTEDPLAQLLSTFAIFAMGFVMRPLGGIIFGHIGDCWGRRKALLYSIILMIIPTLLIGLLPTYQTIGLAAPILLIVLRLLQGISFGGEYIGALAYLLEHAPPDKKIFYAAWPFSGGAVGILLASLAGALTTYTLSDEALMAGGWRLPFLLGMIPAVLGYGLRRHLRESPEFLALAHAPIKKQLPIVEAFRGYWKPMMAFAGMIVPFTVCTYSLFIFLPSFLNVERGFSYPLVFSLNLFPLVFALLITPVVALYGDRWGFMPVYFAGVVGFFICAIPIFMVFAYGSVEWIFVVQSLLIILQCSGTVAFAGVLLKAFPTSVRYTASAVAYNSATSLFGGVTPLVSTFLIAQLGSIAPGYWLCAVSGLGCLSAVMMSRLLQLCKADLNIEKPERA